MGVSGGRTDRTPYIVLAISFLVAAVGGYFGTREVDGGKLATLTGRVQVLEETIPLRREMRDREIHALTARVDRLESVRAGR